MLRCLTIPDNELKAFLLRQPSVMYRMLQVRSAAAAGRERLAELTEKPFPPGDYDVVVVGSGPGGLQIGVLAWRGRGSSGARSSRAIDGPGGMFRKFPVFQRLISWTKPDAPFERGTREYEWYDHNSLLGDEPGHQALAPEFMDRAFDLPARHEMESALVEFAKRGGVRVRYECEWLSTSSQDGQFTLTTTDGDYRCRACVFALGTTDPWKPAIPGLEEAPHYADTLTPDRYAGKSVFIVGKRNSGFEVAQGLLPWARKIVLASPRPVDTTVLAFSPLRLRYLQPFDEHVRGGSGSYVVDAAIERIERHARRLPHPRERHVVGRQARPRERRRSSPRPASAFRSATCRTLGVATISDGRLPAQTPYWESVSVPGDLLRRQRDVGIGRDAEARRDGELDLGERLSLQRARSRAAHRREALRPRAASDRSLQRDEVVPFLLDELARAPELWIQKATSRASSASIATHGIRDEGIVPLAEFVDRGGGDACAVAIEYDADGTIVPVVYVRRAGKLAESRPAVASAARVRHGRASDRARRAPGAAPWPSSRGGASRAGAPRGGAVPASSGGRRDRLPAGA